MSTENKLQSNAQLHITFNQSIDNSEKDFEKDIYKETMGHLKPKTSRQAIKHIKNILIYNICKRIMGNRVAQRTLNSPQASEDEVLLLSKAHHSLTSISATEQIQLSY